MGLLKMLAFPITGPLWIAEILKDEAERQMYDVDAIRHQMIDLDRQREAGDIDPETFDHMEERLLARLMEAREYHRDKSRAPQDTDD